MSRRARQRKGRNVQPGTPPAAKDPSQQLPAELVEVSPEFLDRLPEETRIAYIQSASFRGPIPPPVLFGQYEEILEGSADRIMKLAEREQLHRQQWESTVLGYQASDMRRGQWLGFLLGALGILATVVCAYLDRPYIAGLSIGTVLAGILTSFFRKQPPPNSDD